MDVIGSPLGGQTVNFVEDLVPPPRVRWRAPSAGSPGLSPGIPPGDSLALSPRPGESAPVYSAGVSGAGGRAPPTAGLRPPDVHSTSLIIGNKSVAKSEVVAAQVVSEPHICLTYPNVQESCSGGSIEGLPRRLERFAEKLERSRAMAKWLARQAAWAFFRPVADALESCGSFLMFRHFLESGQVRLFDAKTCKKTLLCPLCAGLRGSNHLAQAIPKIRQVLGSDLVLYLWTVTIRNESALAPMAKRLHGLIGKVLQRRRNEGKGLRAKRSPWSEFKGGIVSTETKRGRGSGLWHVHAHAVVIGRPGLVPGEFQEAWSELVGYKAQSDLRPFDCNEALTKDRDSAATDQALGRCLLEVFKYAMKFSELSFADNWEAYRTLQGKRLIRSFGSLFNVSFPEVETEDCADLQDEAFRDLFFRMVWGRYVEVPDYRLSVG